MRCLSVFHMAESTVSALYRPRELGFASFMVNHSTAYTLATVAAWVEYAIEATFFPSMKTSSFLTVLGFCASCAFYAVRIVAMVQCGSNFNLQIETDKRDEHELVTSGVYAYLRHPSYFGWFWYSVSTQVMLANPVCLVVYARASWFFFKNRIEFEEEVLGSRSFFGPKYADNQKRTVVGIPLIN